jgi:hypothetical protein
VTCSIQFCLYSLHLLQVKRCLIQNLHKRTSTLYQEWQDLFNEISSLSSVVISKVSLTRLWIPRVAVIWIMRKSLWLCVYPKSEGCFREVQTYMDWSNIRTIFKTKHTLRNQLMKARLERDLQQTAQWVYVAPCECDRSYTGQPARPPSRQWSKWVIKHRSIWYESSSVPSFALPTSAFALHQAGQYIYC